MPSSHSAVTDVDTFPHRHIQRMASKTSISSLSNQPALSGVSNSRGETPVPSINTTTAGSLRDKPAHQLRAYSGKTHKVLQHAKQYLHYYLISQEAFPDQETTTQFIREAFDRAAQDQAMDLAMSDAQAKLVSHFSSASWPWYY